MQTISFGESDIETPKEFSFTRSLCFPLLWNSMAEILYNNANTMGFRILLIRSKCLLEDYLYSDTGQDYDCFLSQMLEASPAQIPTFSKTFRCLFLSLAITQELICGSGFFPLVCSANTSINTGLDLEQLTY